MVADWLLILKWCSLIGLPVVDIDKGADWWLDLFDRADWLMDHFIGADWLLDLF